MMSNPNLWSIEAEALELTRDAANTDGHTGGHYDLKFWYGNDNNRLYLKAAGEIEQSQLQQHSTSALWWRPFSPFWNTVAGINLEGNETRKSLAQKSQIWLAGGISGLAPYWFDLDAMAYVSTRGHSRFELHGRYDLYITQKLVLQPELELMAYGKTDASYAYGAGLAQISSAVRVRYDIWPQFSPYIGVERERSLGKTADFHSAQTGQTKLLLGVQFWY
jgi:copper resistance protein B